VSSFIDLYPAKLDVPDFVNYENQTLTLSL